MAHSSFGPDGQSEVERRRELAASGPIIDVELRGTESSVAALPAAGLIDTGASVVCIDRRMALQLDLTPVNLDDVGVAGGGTVTATIYMGVLRVPALHFEELTPLYAIPMKHPNHRVLLGRSFLKNFIITFDGPRGMFHFFTPGHGADHGVDDFAT